MEGGTCTIRNNEKKTSKKNLCPIYASNNIMPACTCSGLFYSFLGNPARRRGSSSGDYLNPIGGMPGSVRPSAAASGPAANLQFQISNFKNRKWETPKSKFQISNFKFYFSIFRISSHLLAALSCVMGTWTSSMVAPNMASAPAILV